MSFGGTLLDTGLSAVLAGPAPMILGGIVLAGHEVPASVRIGGTQALVIHRLPGGRRILDVMGPDEGAIAWNGLLTGPEASGRALLLGALRRQGKTLTLSFGDSVMKVVISHFEYAYQAQGAIIPYGIRLEVAEDFRAFEVIQPTGFTAALADAGIGESVIKAGILGISTYSSLAIPSAQQGIGIMLGKMTEAQSLVSGLVVGGPEAPTLSSLTMARSLTENCLDGGDVASSIDMQQVSNRSGVIEAMLTCGIAATAARARGYIARAQSSIK